MFIELKPEFKNYNIQFTYDKVVQIHHEYSVQAESSEEAMKIALSENMLNYHNGFNNTHNLTVEHKEDLLTKPNLVLKIDGVPVCAANLDQALLNTDPVTLESLITEEPVEMIDDDSVEGDNIHDLYDPDYSEDDDEDHNGEAQPTSSF